MATRSSARRPGAPLVAGLACLLASACASEPPPSWVGELLGEAPAAPPRMTTLAYAEQPQSGKLVDDAMAAIERDNPALKGVLPGNFNSSGSTGMDALRGRLTEVSHAGWMVTLPKEQMARA